MIDWAALLDSLGVQYWTSGKNVATDCVNICCPFCDDHSNHGGFNTKTGSYNCWRCEGGAPAVAISRVSGIPVQTATQLIRQYTTGGVVASNKLVAAGTTLKLPGRPIEKYHRDYLEKRGFDPDELVFYHGILGTGPVDKWEGIDFRLRVVIPISDPYGNIVNFQGRDITGKQELRYKCCPVEKAIVHHKHLLYGADLCRRKDQIVVVEGVFDAWRLGAGAVATFGTSVTREQINAMANWRKIFVAFDPEPDAQEHAHAIARELSVLGRDVEVVKYECGQNPDGTMKDFGDISQDEARDVMKELGF